MKFGLYAINYGTCGDPESLVKVAQYAESAGLDSLWAGEHIVVPSPQPPDYGIAPEIPFLDAIVALALGSGAHDDDHRRHRRHRTPVASAGAARQATRECRPDLACGRLIVGIGVGYLGLEFAALGVSLDERASRTEEYLHALPRCGRATPPSSMASTSTSLESTPIRAPCEPAARRF